MALGSKESPAAQPTERSTINYAFPRNPKEVKACVDVGELDTVLDNLEDTFNVILRKDAFSWIKRSPARRIAAIYDVLLDEGMFSNYRTLWSLHLPQIKKLQPEILTKVLRYCQDETIDHGKIVGADSVKYIVGQREYWDVADDVFISAMQYSTTGRRTLAKQSQKFEEARSPGKLRSVMMSAEDNIALANLAATSRRTKIDRDQVISSLFLEPEPINWDTLLSTLGRMWPQLSTETRKGMTDKLLSFAASMSTRDSVHNYYLDILEKSDLIPVNKPEQIDILADKCDNIIYCLEYLQTSPAFSPVLMEKIARILSPKADLNIKNGLINYYLDNDFYLGFKRLMMMVPEYNWFQWEDQLPKQITRNLDEENFLTAHRAWECLVHILEKNGQLPNWDDYEFSAKISLSELEGKATTEIAKRNAISPQREAAGVINSPRAIILSTLNFLVMDQYQAQKQAHEEGSAKREMGIKGREFYAHKLFDTEFGGQAREQALEFFEWLKQYFIITVQKELAYQRDLRGDNGGIVPFGKDLPTTGTAEEVRLFFMKAGSFFSKHYSGSGRSSVSFGGENWVSICDLGRRMWSVDEGSLFFYKKDNDQPISVGQLIDEFIQVRHNSGYLLDNEPRALYSAELGSGLLDFLKDEKSPRKVIAYAVDRYYIDRAEANYYLKAFDQLGIN